MAKNDFVLAASLAIICLLAFLTISVACETESTCW